MSTAVGSLRCIRLFVSLVVLIFLALGGACDQIELS